MFTEASNYAYFGVLHQAVSGPVDLRPIAYTLGSYSDMQERWSVTEKEAFAVYQSVSKFNLYLRETQCILHCHHKPLEPFLSCEMKIPKLDHWSVEQSGYNLTFGHIKGTTSRLKILEIYTEQLENPKIAALSNTEECIAEVVTNKIQTLHTDRLHAR